MLKKALFCNLIAALITELAVATPAPYVGASLGVINNTNSSHHFRGIPFNAFAGYGGVITQNFYLAGEAMATVGTGEISNHHLKTTYGYGASIIPGIMLSDHTLAFTRAGVARARFADKTVTGGQLGLGLQTSLTQNVDLRGEYDFTAYHSFNHTNSTISSPRSDAFNLGVVYKFE
jgi:Outer membrane protein beta-barrel domain